jgi:hypothetical protein
MDIKALPLLTRKDDLYLNVRIFTLPPVGDGGEGPSPWPSPHCVGRGIRNWQEDRGERCASFENMQIWAQH